MEPDWFGFGHLNFRHHLELVKNKFERRLADGHSTRSNHSGRIECRSKQLETKVNGRTDFWPDGQCVDAG